MGTALVAIESSAQSGGGVAVWRADSGLICKVDLEESMRGGVGLAPAVCDCVRTVGGWAGVGAIAVDQGPGSYTGLRVGVMLAKALAWGRSLPLFGASALDVLAAAWGRDGVLVPVVTARRGEVYAARYRCSREGADCLRPMATLTPETLFDEVQALAEPLHLTGSGVSQLPASGWRDGVTVTPVAVGCDAGVLARLCGERWAGGAAGADQHAFQPLYPRRPGVTLPVLGEPVEKRR